MAIAMESWPERLAEDGRYEEMNAWMKKNIAACPKENLREVLGMYEDLVDRTIEDCDAPESIDQKDAILEAWKQGHASEDLSDLDDVLKGKKKKHKASDEPSVPKGTPVVNADKKIYPNDPCPCGSGKKYKKCCGKKA